MHVVPYSVLCISYESETVMLDYAVALTKAQQIATAFAPACDHVWIAGSIRREKPHIRDIELVVVPHFRSIDLFGIANMDAGSDLDGLLTDFLDRGALKPDPELPRNGSRYKRFIVTSVQTPLDLFIAEPRNAGNILMIRTGDSDFSRKLVTPRALGGLMPRDYRHAEGYLWHGDSLLPCPDEQTLFAHLGIAFDDIPSPRDRTIDCIPHLRRCAGVTDDE